MHKDIKNCMHKDIKIGDDKFTSMDGVVIESENGIITIYEDTTGREELGYLSANVYGLKDW